MTIYLLRWSENQTEDKPETKKYIASGNYQKLVKTYKDISSNSNITIQEIGEAITKHAVKKQDETIELINSLAN